jgi:beta-galactosidase/beta-glucuronidase
MPCNDGWLFHQGFSHAFLEEEINVMEWEHIELPHTPHQVLPTYHEEGVFCRTYTYRRACSVKLNADQTLSFRFEGIANRARFYWNGVKVAEHEGSYLPITVEVEGRRVAFSPWKSMLRRIPPSSLWCAAWTYLSFSGIYTNGCHGDT